ncbi:MAG: hypothetical protein ACK50J_13800, partial [Planctomyces sp.]
MTPSSDCISLILLLVTAADYTAKTMFFTGEFHPDHAGQQEQQVKQVVSCLCITTAFTGLRPVDARKTKNPPAATPVQRFVIWLGPSLYQNAFGEGKHSQRS